MKALAIWLVLVAVACGQDIKMKTPHKLVPSTSSPFTVELPGDFDAVHFWLEGATSKAEDGNEATFEAAPGWHRIRCYGLKWSADGRLNPVVKKESHVLVVAATVSINEPWEEISTPPPPPRPQTIKPPVQEVRGARAPSQADLVRLRAKIQELTKR